MPDVQKNNNLSISNWQPPTEPVDNENWQPPTAPINAKPAEPRNSDWLNSLATNVLNPPEFVTRSANKLANRIDPSGVTPQGGILDAAEAIPSVLRNLFTQPLATLRGGLAGATEGAATQLSPANISMAMMPEGRGLKLVGQGIGALQGIRGAKKIYENNDWTGGLADIGFGTLGILGSSIPKGIPEGGPHIVIPNIPAKIQELIKRGYKLVAKHDNGTVSMALGETSGNFIPPAMTRFRQPNLPGFIPIQPNLPTPNFSAKAEPTRSPNLDPNRFPIPGTVTPQAKGPTAEEQAFNIAREKFNMARDLPVERTRADLDKNSPHGSVAKTVDAMIEKHGVNKAFERAMSVLERNKPGTLGHDYWRMILNDIEDRITPSDMRVPIPGHAPDNIAMGPKMEGGTRLLDIVGNSTYNKPMPQIITKELLQNSFDEHRISGQTKPIAVGMMWENPNPRTGELQPSISVRDFGRGLTPDQLYTVFTNVGQTGKGGVDSASGGFGIAKAAPMLGGKFFRAESIVQEGNKKVKYTFEGTKAELKDQEKGVPLQMTVLGRGNDEPVGLKVTTWLPDNAPIHLVEDVTRNMTENSPSITSPTIYGSTYNDVNKMKQFLDHPEIKTPYSIAENAKKFTKLPEKPEQGKISIPGADIEIHYEDDPKTTSNDYYLHFLNKGLYQDSQREFYGKNLDNVPKNITANVIATVEEGEENYPFASNREQLNSKVTQAIGQWINKNIKSGALAKHEDLLKKTYAQLGNFPMSGTIRKASFFDPGTRLTPDERLKFNQSPRVKEIIRLFDRVLDDAVTTVDKEYGDTKRQDKLEGTGLYTGTLHHYGIHIPNPQNPINKSSILINPFAWMVSNNPEKASLQNIITALHEVAHISSDTPIKPDVQITGINDPRIGKLMQLFMEHKREQGGINAAHDIDFIKRLAEVFTSYGPEKTFNAADEFKSIVTDRSGGYNAEIQELLRIYKEAQGRPETTKDVISSTGSHAKSTKGGSGSSDSSNRPDGERTPPNKQLPINNSTKNERNTPDEVIGRLTNAIRDALPQRAAQENMYSIERAKRIAAAMKVFSKEGNQTIEGHNKAKAKLAGELPKIDYEGTKLSDSDVNSLIAGIVNSPYLLPYEKIRATDGLRKLLSDGPVPQRNELELLRQAYGKSFDQIVEMHGGLGAIMPKLAVVSDVLNLPKAIMASYDLSAPLRQGLPLIHKKEWWGAIIPMIQSLKDPKYYEALQQSIKDHSNYLLAKEAKLGLTDIGDVPNKEEAFPTKLASQIPGLAMSERAYTGFLNKLRFDTFNALIDDAKKLGIHPKDSMFEIAKFVNTFTGRGSLDFSGSRFAKALGQGRANFANFDKVSNELNTVFFSPRLIASRLTILNPRYYVKASPFIRKEAMKALMAIAGAGMAVNSIMSLFGSKTNTSLSDSKGPGLIPGTNGIPGLPINADFGKSRFGNTRDDPWAGLQQYAVFAGRMLSGESESSVTGKRSILGKGYNANTRYNVLDDFIGNKLAPIPSLARVALKQKDYEGNPIQFAPDIEGAKESFGKGDILDGLTKGLSGELANRYKPMLLNDLLELYKDDPNAFPVGLKPLLATHAVFGGSLQTYKKSRGSTNSQFRLHLQK